MKKLVLLLLLFSLVTVYGQKPSIQIIPQPVEVQPSDGSFTLTKSSTIGYDSQDCRKIADMLSEKLNHSTGFSIKPQQDKAGSIQFILNKVPVPQIGKEGYTLVSSAKGVIISANAPAGLFYGMQTLLQLFLKKLKANRQ